MATQRQNGQDRVSRDRPLGAKGKPPFGRTAGDDRIDSTEHREHRSFQVLRQRVPRCDDSFQFRIELQ